MLKTDVQFFEVVWASMLEHRSRTRMQLWRYVAEQHEQEVSENHSTFVEIVAGMEEEAAPPVLRWNDSANQPERIVHRSKALSANELLWTRWSGRGWRVLLGWSSWVHYYSLAGLPRPKC